MAEKKKKVEQEEDFSTEQLQRFYRKRCEYNGVPLSRILKERIDTAVTDGDHITKVHLWEELGPVGVRAIMEAFQENSYPN